MLDNNTNTEFEEVEENDVFLKYKKYLHKEIALLFPPALAAVYGLGPAPFRLYDAVGFDRLHVPDLGTERYLQDFAFNLFGNASYNKGKFSDVALLRLANARFRTWIRFQGCTYRCSD